jgi:hypothetical protein
VGLIVIESFAEPAERATQTGASDDATLGQVLRRLAREAAAERGPAAVTPSTPRPGAHRFSGIAERSNQPVPMAADCRGLGAELEQAARRLRRKIAADARIAR